MKTKKQMTEKEIEFCEYGKYFLTAEKIVPSRKKVTYNYVVISDKNGLFPLNSLLSDKELETAKKKYRYEKGIECLRTIKAMVYEDSLYKDRSARYGVLYDFPEKDEFFTVAIKRLDKVDVTHDRRQIILLISKSLDWAFLYGGWAVPIVKEEGDNYRVYLDSTLASTRQIVRITMQKDDGLIRAGKIEYYCRYNMELYSEARYRFIQVIPGLVPKIN